MRPHKQIRLGPDRPYDVIVCGAGHAGVEAALAAARAAFARASGRVLLAAGDERAGQQEQGRHSRRRRRLLYRCRC